MHVKEYEIITDFMNGQQIKCEKDVIAIANNLACAVCGDATEFDPLISDGIKWHCVNCWAESGYEAPSEGTKVRLKDAQLTTKANYLIRNM